MKTALIDTNVILDLLLEREPFFENAGKLWNANHQKKYNGYIAPITLINVFYIVRKQKGLVEAKQAVEKRWRPFGCV